ncbi:MAG: hypothetical protein E7566_05775 [Ruminococcaceae bacterium]|nr:hypothetical protein [Oscillospiraceae bacterium]
MFRLVLGRSKSGKTEYVRNYLGALASQGEDKLLMIVPDQQSFDTEKAFLELLGAKDAMRVKVLGFSRLCDYVFDILGYSVKTLADDSVRTLIMGMALEDTSDMLRLYSDKAFSPQLLSKMLSVQKEFVRNKVTKEMFQSEVAKNNTILRDKLYDTELILSAYDALLSSSFQDAESELSLVNDLLLKNNIFDGYYVCVDSYLSFTELELEALRILMSQCKELLVTLSDDNSDAEDSFFDISKSTAKRLLSFAKEDGVSISSPLLCDYEDFFTKPELSHIEKNIFDYTAKFEKLPINPSDSPVCIYNASNIYEESDFVARKIRELVLTKGYRYNDIAVVCRDVTPYRNILDTALSKYSIEYFMDSPSSIHSKPLIKLITACFDAITTGFDKEAVLAIVKSGLVCSDITTVGLFENYIFTWGISGSKFKSEFTANPRGFADEFNTNDLYELTKIEEIRKFVITPLVEFREKAKNATAETICKELYKLLLTLDVDKHILALCDVFEKSGEQRAAEELTRLWQMLCDTLDRTIAVIGNRIVAPKRFKDLLLLQFSSQDMSFIPRVLDQVTVGDIEHLRLSDKKVVFVIGAVEGEFPRATSDSGLFTDAERQLLCEAGVLTDKSPDRDYLREEYLCYYALTSASDMLFVSYPSSNLKGASSVHSEIISSLKSLFTGLEEVNSFSVPIADRLWAAKPSFDIFAERLNSDDALSKALGDYYRSKDEYTASVKALENSLKPAEHSITDRKIAENLFGSNMFLSASQVEKFYLCRFSYLMNYGLRLRERERAEIDNREYGSFVHYILEHFIKAHTKMQMSSMEDMEIEESVTQIAKEYAELHFGGLSDKSQRFIYLFERVIVNTAKLLRHLIDELVQSSFNPEAFELSIGDDIPAYSLTLPTGQNIIIRGKVDRADIMRTDDKTYIRVVDYKTGTKVFELSDVMFGINMQMLIYLSAISKDTTSHFGSDITPAGVLYVPSVYPVIKAKPGNTEEDVLKAQNKKLQMNGLILQDMDVLQGMDREMQGKFIPAYIKNGQLKGAGSLASLEQMGAIFSYIDKLVGEMATELYGGKISAKPAVGRYKACDYCPYGALCKHTEDDPSRNIFKYDAKEINEILGIKEEEVAE